MFDTDQNGKLDIQEAKDYIEVMGKDVFKYEPGEALIIQIFEQIEDTADGLLSKEEMLRHLKAKRIQGVK